MSPANISKAIVRLTVSTALIAAIFIASRAGAEDGKAEAFMGHIKYEKFHSDYDVNADGTYTLVHDTLIDVLTEQGVKYANQTKLSYSESLDEAVILSAYTLKKDGRRIDVPPSNIQDREAVSGGGPMFSDIKSKSIIFPDVAAGDKVAFSYKFIRKIALYPGQFSLTRSFSKFMVVDDERLSVRVPLNSLDLKVFATGVQGGRVQDEDGHAKWVWTYKNQEMATPEPGSVDPLDYGPRIVVSSFKDYGAIAASYEERARPKAAVTDKIRELATELTAGATGQREKAQAIHKWVVQNIRFAGNYMGVGSVVPHDAETVLANRLGDCKDHTALFQALLAAVGIESTPVMINAGSIYKLPEVPSTTVLNHIMTYIPSLDLYVDSTSEYTPFGRVPPTACAKPAVHTANFDHIRQIPNSSCSYEANTSQMKMVLHIHEDGSADGETTNNEIGVFATMMKGVMSHVQPNLEELFVRSILEKSGYTGTGTLTKGDPRELSDSYAWGLKYHLTNAMNLPGPGAVYIQSASPSAHSIAAEINGVNRPDPTLDRDCMGDIAIEEFSLDLPKNIKITALPKDVHLNDGRVRYDSTYRQEGNTVTAIRRFEDRTEGPICSPESCREFKSIAREVMKDLKAQLIYQPADGA